jgi:hypothetical protein
MGALLRVVKFVTPGCEPSSRKSGKDALAKRSSLTRTQGHERVHPESKGISYRSNNRSIRWMTEQVNKDHAVRYLGGMGHAG